ncbi:short-chain dehydrogenase/reductase SDR [Penicillium lividum]|nr:short-chain dehydrogenase/reductase SDR [Penicillium lividum]
MSVAGKKVFITGAASGLGKAVSITFARLGASVALCDIDKKKTEATLASLPSAGDSIAIQADISDENEVTKGFSQSVQHFGRIDALINCAGIMDRFAGAGETDYSTWKRVMGVNLSAPFYLSKLAINDFLRDDRGAPKGGTIIHVSSLAALRNGFGGAAYVASKSGLIGLTKNTAALYSAHGVRCNAILPGHMATNFVNFMANEGPDENGWRVASHIAKADPGAIDLDKAGQLMAFLVSDAGQDINGALISVDRGWSTT